MTEYIHSNAADTKTPLHDKQHPYFDTFLFVLLCFFIAE